MATTKPPKLGRRPLDEKDPLVHKGFRLPTSLVKRLTKLAKASKKKESELLRELLEETLSRVGG